MKELNELFGNEFVLKITNKIDSGTHYVSNVQMQSYPADYEEESIKFHLDERNKFDTKIEGPKAVQGNIRHNGYSYLMGDYRYNKQVVKSIGGLIALDVYDMEPDDVLCAYLANSKGTVILDKDLNVVYENFYRNDKIFYNQQDAYKFLHDFGPEALAFMDAKDFNPSIQNDVKRVYDLRVKHQEEKFINPEEIAEEKQVFDKAFNIMKKEYENIQAKHAGMER